MTPTIRKSLTAALASLAIGVAGCTAFPFSGTFRGQVKADADARVVADAAIKGALEVKLATAPDPGPMTAIVVREAHSGPSAARSQTCEP